MTNKNTNLNNTVNQSFGSGLNGCLFGILVVISQVRGLLELYFGRSTANIIQVGVVVVVWFVIQIRAHGSISLRSSTVLKHQWLIYFVLIVFSLFSVLTTWLAKGEFGIQYIYVILFNIIMVQCSVVACRGLPINNRILFWILAVSTSFSGFVAILQSNGIISNFLPGYTWFEQYVRPPSLTGSYLHYPLVLAISLSVCVVSTIKITRFAVVPLVFQFICLMYSFSRGGQMMFALFVVGIIIKSESKIKIQLIFSIAIVFLMLGFYDIGIVSSGDLVNRILSTFDGASHGNEDRLRLWVKAVSMFDWINLVSGNCFGLITNSGTEDAKEIYGIVESSLLQQLLNIGVPGTVVFYLMYFRLISAMPDCGKFLKAILFAAMVESVTYQSLEVIPFIIMVNVVPAFGSMDIFMRTYPGVRLVH